MVGDPDQHAPGARRAAKSPDSVNAAGDEVIMSIAGHVSRAMLSRYSPIRMEAKRRALDEIATRQTADEKRKAEVERQQLGGGAIQAVVVQ